MVGDSVLYPFFFIPIYIVIRIAYGKLMRRLPVYRRLLEWTRHGQGTEMLSFVDLLKPSSDAGADFGGEGKDSDQEPGARP